MAVDESSSQDSTLIDEDLVAALGFEPVTTIEAPTDDTSEANGDTPSPDDASDSVSDDVAVADKSRDLNGFGIDQVNDEAAQDEAVPGEILEVTTTGEAASDADLLVDESENTTEPAPPSDEIAPDPDADDRASFFDLEDGATDAASAGAAGTDDKVIEAELASVPSIADPELEADATAPVGLIDASDEEAVAPVIDLDTVDLSDGPVDEVSAQGFAEAEMQELADADSVFADSTPVLDPQVFDDQFGHPATETIGRVDSGMLDLETAEETVGGVVAAEAASAAPSKRRRRLRARKSRRVIRHIDPWSVLTFSVLFHMVVFAALLLASVLVWNAAIASGMVENVESFIQELGDYETFEINADVMFRAAIVIAGMLTLASSVLVVLLTVVFNLISDLVGGIRVTVIEEETVRVPIDKKRSKARNE